MKLRITYKKSSIGYSKSQKATIRSLGLRKLNSISIRDDNNSIRGMIFSVKHLVTVEEVADDTVVTPKPVRNQLRRQSVAPRVEDLFAPAVVEAATPRVAPVQIAPMPVATAASPVSELAQAAGRDAAPILETPLATSGLSDDLEIVEGIGPKIAHVLRTEGITSLTQLATTEVEVLRDILSRNKLAQIAHPETWSQQAKLAAEGKFDELMQWQRTLNSGRVS